MWVITTQGFYSIVRKPNDRPGQLTIRTRRLADLERFRQAVPLATEIETHAGTDYQYRCHADQVDVASWLAGQVMEIKYGNFKAAVCDALGRRYELVLHRVWSELYRLSRL